MTKNIQVVFLVLAVMTQSIDGFSSQLPLLGLKTETTALPAWSMPLPSFSSQSFASFSTPYWYIDIANPTARRPVYNDSPYEYNFVSPGHDWPSSNEIVDKANKQQQGRMGPFRPIRRLAQWARNRGLSGSKQV